MKKLALVVSGLSSGGVESFILSFFNEINSVREYDKYIITHNVPSKATQEKFENLGFKIFIVPSKKENIFNNIKSLNKIITEGLKPNTEKLEEVKREYSRLEKREREKKERR